MKLRWQGGAFAKGNSCGAQITRESTQHGALYILMLDDIEAGSTTAERVWPDIVGLQRQRREALRKRSSE